MKKVLIATPAYDGKIASWSVAAMCTAFAEAAANGIKLDLCFTCFDSLIQRARNDLFTYAMENKFDGMVWLDSDMTWSARWIFEVINSGEDVIGLPCVIKSSTEEKYNVGCSPQDLSSTDKYIAVDWVGTGFLYLSNKAMQYLWDNSVVYKFCGRDQRWVFELHTLKDGSIIGEDVALCRKLREGGFRVVIDPSKTCGHLGPSKYEGDFSVFRKQITTLRLSK